MQKILLLIILSIYPLMAYSQPDKPKKSYIFGLMVEMNSNYYQFDNLNQQLSSNSISSIENSLLGQMYGFSLRDSSNRYYSACYLGWTIENFQTDNLNKIRFSENYMKYIFVFNFLKSNKMILGPQIGIGIKNCQIQVSGVNTNSFSESVQSAGDVILKTNELFFGSLGLTAERNFNFQITRATFGINVAYSIPFNKTKWKNSNETELTDFPDSKLNGLVIGAIIRWEFDFTGKN